MSYRQTLVTIDLLLPEPVKESEIEQAFREFIGEKYPASNPRVITKATSFVVDDPRL